MNANDKINVDNNWKEVVKGMVDKCNNLNDFQKELIKFCLEMQHEDNKKQILKSTKNQ